jgi:plasmid stabilization system protein ParE
MRLQFSTESKGDLREIGDYIALDNPIRALTFIGELEECCRALVDMPLRFPQIQKSGVEMRRRVFKGYSIFYVVDGDAVVVARILNDAVDYEQKLFPEA